MSELCKRCGTPIAIDGETGEYHTDTHCADLLKKALDEAEKDDTRVQKILARDMQTNEILREALGTDLWNRLWGPELEVLGTVVDVLRNRVAELEKAEWQRIADLAVSEVSKGNELEAKSVAVAILPVLKRSTKKTAEEILNRWLEVRTYDGEFPSVALADETRDFLEGPCTCEPDVAASLHPPPCLKGDLLERRAERAALGIGREVVRGERSLEELIAAFRRLVPKAEQRR